MSTLLFPLSLVIYFACTRSFSQGLIAVCAKCEYEASGDFSHSNLRAMIRSGCKNVNSTKFINEQIDPTFCSQTEKPNSEGNRNWTFTPEKYCAQFRYEANTTETPEGQNCWVDPDRDESRNVTFEIRYRFCFSSTVGFLEGCTSYIKKIHGPTCDNKTLFWDKGLTYHEFISPDHPELKKFLPIMTLSTYLCGNDDGCSIGKDRDIAVCSGNTVGQGFSFYLVWSTLIIRVLFM